MIGSLVAEALGGAAPTRRRVEPVRAASVHRDVGGGLAEDRAPIFALDAAR